MSIFKMTDQNLWTENQAFWLIDLERKKESLCILIDRILELLTISKRSSNELSISSLLLDDVTVICMTMCFHIGMTVSFHVDVLFNRFEVNCNAYLTFRNKSKKQTYLFNKKARKLEFRFKLFMKSDVKIFNSEMWFHWCNDERRWFRNVIDQTRR